jgi:hypothetical protein
MVTPSPPRNAARSTASAAERLTNAADTTRRAPAAAAAASAGVPLVVASSTVRPATASRVKSPGELPRSNPGTRRMWRSPASTTSERA